MRRLSFALTILILFALAGCKSHKTTVVRPSASDIVRPSKPAVVVQPVKADDPTMDVDPEVGRKLAATARGWIGAPYKYGGDSKSGTDCSGMLMSIFKEIVGLSLPRNSAEQRNYCFEVPKSTLQPGDLVFFSGSKHGGNISHVGMYVGEGHMIHASSSRGVIESGLDEAYYTNHYHSSGRVYGITYAATGGKKANDKRKDDILLADDQSKRRPSKKKVAQPIAKDSVRAVSLDDFVRMSAPKADSVIVSVSPGIKADTVKQVAVADTIRPVACPELKVDSVAVDTVHQSREIRESVIKAMKFGK